MDLNSNNLSNSNAATGNHLLEVHELVKYFPVRSGILQRPSAYVKAVDGVSFKIKAGETVGLVGESGCGKTTVGRSILRLTTATSGEVLYEDKDVLKARPRELKTLRRNM